MDKINIMTFTIGSRFFAMTEIGNIFYGLNDLKINPETSLDEVIAYLLFHDIKEAKNIQTFLLNEGLPVIKGFVIGITEFKITKLEDDFLYTLEFDLQEPKEIEEEVIISVTNKYRPVPIAAYRKALSKHNITLAILDHFVKTTELNLEISADLFIEYQDKQANITPAERQHIIEVIKSL